MRNRTTTKQLSTAITNNLLQITKAECHYKSSDQVDELSKETFKESIDYLSESGIFADCIGWYYEKDYKSGQYIVECGRMDGSVEKIIAVYLRVCNNVKVEDIEKALLFEEE